MMESYQLNNIWDGKMEPLSPSPLDAEDFMLLEDDFANEIFNDGIFETTFEDVTKKSPKELFNELVAHLDGISKVSAKDLLIIADEGIDEEEQWLEEKSNISMLEDYPAAVPDAPVYIQPVNTQNTNALIMEFDSIYDAVELTHLTPPQTPPQQLQQHYVDVVAIGVGAGCVAQQQQQQQQQLFQQINYQQLLQQQQQQQSQSQPERQLNISQIISFDDEYNFNNEMTTTDIARELEVVDELVRSRSKDLPDWTTDDDSVSCSGLSSGSVSGASPRSEASSYASSNYSNDDEWSPKSSSTSSLSSSSSSSKAQSSGQLKLSAGSGVTKKRTRPYARGGGEEKKSRKKEQNKNAATRYRQKKKAEIEEVLIEERILAEKNDKLQSKYNDLRLEIKYLKNLMKDLCKSKGLLD